MTNRSTGPACGNNPHHQMSDGDRQTVADFRSYLELRAATWEQLERAIWVDGDPLMEAIAAAVWEHCRTERPSRVIDHPRNIAAVAAAVARAAASSAGQAPATDRADDDVRDQVLHALDFAYCQGIGYSTPEELLAAYDASRTPAPAGQAEAVLRLVETALGDTLVASARDEALAGIAAVLHATPVGQAAVLTDSERQFLAFALDLAQEQMFSRGDEFTDEDEAALKLLRRMADETPAAEVVPCVNPEPHCAHLHSGLRKGIAVHGRCPGEPAAGARQDEPRPSTPPCVHCTHPKSDHDGRADHRAKHSPLVAGEPWCHACNASCDYAATARQDGAQP
jgi:hypothetical protein